MRFRNHHAGCCGLNPTRPDGSEWSHVLGLHDGSTAHADTAAEVLEELLPGYLAADADGRRSRRIAHAHRVASAAQEVRITETVARGLLDTDDPDQATLLQVLRADKALSLLLETDDSPGEQAAWLALPELVLVATSYSPHEGPGRIDGNVVWLDPDTEDGYLRSLRDAGAYDYWTAQRP